MFWARGGICFNILCLHMFDLYCLNISPPQPCGGVLMPEPISGTPQRGGLPCQHTAVKMVPLEADMLNRPGRSLRIGRIFRALCAFGGRAVNFKTTGDILAGLAKLPETVVAVSLLTDPWDMS